MAMSRLSLVECVIISTHLCRINSPFPHAAIPDGGVSRLYVMAWSPWPFGNQCFSMGPAFVQIRVAPNNGYVSIGLSRRCDCPLLKCL